MIAAALLAVAPLTEDKAVELTVRAMELLGPAAAKGCLAYEIEESSKARFDIAVREIHDDRCGGAPEVMPVIERFRVGRGPVAVARYDVINDRWLDCRMLNGRPTC
jgi:hypothetical protein